MNRLLSLSTLVASLVILPATLYTQTAEGNRLVVPLSDPSRPALLKVVIIHGSITVKGSTGKEVVVEGHRRGTKHIDREDRGSPKTKGLRRILPNTSSGLHVEEDGNTVTVNNTGFRGDSGSMDLLIHVPHATSVILSTINDGVITVSNVRGNVEISNPNGDITLTDISGSAVLHSLHGHITASFNSVDSKKSMSFISLNGDIDVTLPQNTKATLQLKNDYGEIYSDFDNIKPRESSSRVEKNSKKNRGKYKLWFNKVMTMYLNGGGSDIIFNNINGGIYIRKGK